MNGGSDSLLKPVEYDRSLEPTEEARVSARALLKDIADHTGHLEDLPLVIAMLGLDA